MHLKLLSSWYFMKSVTIFIYMYIKSLLRSWLCLGLFLGCLAYALGRHAAHINNFCNSDELNQPFYACMWFFPSNCESRLMQLLEVYTAFSPCDEKQLTDLFFSELPFRIIGMDSCSSQVTLYWRKILFTKFHDNDAMFSVCFELSQGARRSRSHPPKRQTILFCLSNSIILSIH